MIYNFDFLAVPKKEISLDKIETLLDDQQAKRIHFATSHADSLKAPTDNNNGKISLPFNETIEPILSHSLSYEGTYLFKSQFRGFWRAFNSVDEYSAFKAMITEYENIVFLRDNLDLSLALSINKLENGERTKIGELEYQAKFQDNEEAEAELTVLTQTWLEKLPFYSKADCICAMPCSDQGSPGLPRRIVDKLVGFENISSQIPWTKKDKNLKDLDSVKAKLDALKEFGLQVNMNLEGKNVILLDDLYMSGLSIQYVAMKLKQAGADRVFGLSIVKSWSNTAR